jgi:hypothetical protein
MLMGKNWQLCLSLKMKTGPKTGFIFLYELPAPLWGADFLTVTEREV